MFDTITTSEIDFAFDEDTMRAARIAFEKRFPCVRMTIVNAEGPAGGWPEVTLTGERRCVEQALREAWDMGDPNGNDEFVASVVPAA